MAQRVLIIYNPKAGKSEFLSHLAEVVELCTKAGLTVEVYPTQAPRDAIEKAANLPSYIDEVLVAGGDGTLDEVVTGLVRGGLDIPIGYIPVGSTNDFASSLGLSSNIKEATGDVLGGRPHGVDVGRFNDDSFVYVAAFGAFTEVAYKTDQEVKNQLGHLAYLLEGVQHLGDIQAFPMQIKIDENILDGRFIFGMITNSISVGGFKGITGENLYLNDGLFEVTLIREAKNLLEFREIIGSLLTNNPSPFIETFNASALQITSPEEISWTLDGEFGGLHKDVDIRVIREGIHLLLDEGEHHML